MPLDPSQDRASRPIYLDCAATTPPDPRVVEVMRHFLTEGFGNPGSHTHAYGNQAQHAVEKARGHVAELAGVRSDEVFFTSGATESNNLALFGLAHGPLGAEKRHIVSTAIEHKAVLEPLTQLQEQGFEITWVSPEADGRVDSQAVLGALRDDTLVISMMHVNNETGVIQPVAEVAEGLRDHSAYLHVDAAQGFGKEQSQLTPRVDLISVSAHKLYGPQGIGALIARRRDYRLPPLQPLLVGGGQERGLRAGTLPAYLCAGFGEACRIMAAEHNLWWQRCAELRDQLAEALAPFEPQWNGAYEHTLPSIQNVSLGDIDSDAVMLGLRDVVAISNGSACTTSGSDPSHVLASMGLPAATRDAATRWSWCHRTPDLPADEIRGALQHIL